MIYSYYGADKKKHRNTTNLASVNIAQRTRVVKVDD